MAPLKSTAGLQVKILIFKKMSRWGVDFLSQGVVKILLRERPEMVNCKTFELALWKARQVIAQPLMAEACFPTGKKGGDKLP
jgi:hypothetical protein